jgi:hypothetical protein
MLIRIICKNKVRFTVFIHEGKQEVFLVTNNGDILLAHYNTYKKYLERLSKFGHYQLGLLILKNNY